VIVGYNDLFDTTQTCTITSCTMYVTLSIVRVNDDECACECVLGK